MERKGDEERIRNSESNFTEKSLDNGLLSWVSSKKEGGRVIGDEEG